MKSLIERAFHNHWLNVIRKIKGVSSVMHVKSATTPPKFLLHVIVMDGKDKKLLKYKLDKEPSMEMEDEYQFIVSDLTRKGYGK
jgi:hypothetical protein